MERINIMSQLSSTTLQHAGLSRSSAHESLGSGLADWSAALGRVGLAAIFLWSGYGKLVYMDGNIGYMKAFGVPAPELLIWPALLAELIGGAMLLLGLRARWAALALIAFTLPATLIFHAYWGAPADQVMNAQIHFMKNLAILGGLLTVAVHGSGRMALDRA
jgi:putative oxidoreductase